MAACSRLRITQLHEDSVGLYRRSRQHDDALHGSVGKRRDPANLIGHEHAGAVHVAQHGSTLHRLNPQPASFDRWRRRLEAGEADGSNDDDNCGSGARKNAVPPLPLSNLGWSGYVHVALTRSRILPPKRR